jgi:hypothetical protein
VVTVVSIVNPGMRRIGFCVREPAHAAVGER